MILNVGIRQHLISLMALCRAFGDGIAAPVLLGEG
jgi:hypothetical protein